MTLAAKMRADVVRRIAAGQSNARIARDLKLTRNVAAGIRKRDFGSKMTPEEALRLPKDRSLLVAARADRTNQSIAAVLAAFPAHGVATSETLIRDLGGRPSECWMRILLRSMREGGIIEPLPWGGPRSGARPYQRIGSAS